MIWRRGLDSNAAVSEAAGFCVEDGRSCFGSLATRDNRRLAFYVFDLVCQDRDLSQLPLEARKEVLAELVTGGAWNLQYVDHIKGERRSFFEAACGAGFEGIISKRVDWVGRGGAGAG